MNKKLAAQQKTLEEIKTDLNKQLHTSYDPDTVLREAQKKIDRQKLLNEEDGPIEEESKKLTHDDPVFQALTLSEFKNGALMISGLAEQYRTFGIDMLRKLQEEFGCTTVSEMATAELVTTNYIRTLEIQFYIDTCLAKVSIPEISIKFLAVMSKELDRANRHYINALQTLKMMKQLPIKVNVKTNTAIIGQNQLIQENQNVKSI